MKSCNYSAPNGFFGFPDPIKKKTLHKKWLDACGLEEVKKTDVLCFQHFDESHMIARTEKNSRGHPRLKLGAWPIMYENSPLQDCTAFNIQLNDKNGLMF